MARKEDFVADEGRRRLLCVIPVDQVRRWLANVPEHFPAIRGHPFRHHVPADAYRLSGRGAEAEGAEDD